MNLFHLICQFAGFFEHAKLSGNKEGDKCVLATWIFTCVAL